MASGVVYDQIRTSVRNKLLDIGVDRVDISPQSKLRDDLGLDSLSAIELLLEVEEKFCVDIADEEFDKIITVSDLAELVDRKMV